MSVKTILLLALLGLFLSLIFTLLLNRPAPVPSPSPVPPGCYYQSVQCIKAPCDPILVCPTSTPPSGDSDCQVGGCSGQLCVESSDPGYSTCEYRADYACYATATCARQPNGLCGWTPTAELQACLDNPPPLE